MLPLQLLTVTPKSTEPIPYRLCHDNAVVLLLFVAILCVVIIFCHARGWLFAQVASLFKGDTLRSNITEHVDYTARYRLLLTLLTNIVLAICFWDYAYYIYKYPITTYTTWMLLGGYVGVFAIGYVVRRGFYAWVDNVFFTPTQHAQWRKVYSTLYGILGILLLPVCLWMVHFDIPFPQSFQYIISVIGLVEFVLLCKCFAIFFFKRYGILQLLLYFCALEMALCCLLWVPLFVITDLLTIKSVSF